VNIKERKKENEDEGSENNLWIFSFVCAIFNVFFCGCWYGNDKAVKERKSEFD